MEQLLKITEDKKKARENPLLTFDRRIKALKTAQAKILATWAGLNLVIGGIFTFTATNQISHFHAMNASWGLVNLAIAAFLYLHHNSVFYKPLSLLQQMDYQRHVEKMILLNIGLDCTFLAIAFALYQYGKTPETSFPDLWKEFGASILIQGAFLMIQDFIFYDLHLKNRKKVYPVWKNNLDKLG